MIDLLSLPRQAVVDYGHIKSKKIGTGLPINSLPGWEIIPLNSKLPMLKCPGNQVIFTKDKIGQSLLGRLKHDFDTSFQDKIPEYNPLHDLNLRNFYANENNLKRLRENEEITEKNDVICNLKDFNEHRQQIHKSYIYYLMQQRRLADFEMLDRKLMSNAEEITNFDYENLNLRSQSFHEILKKRAAIDGEKAIEKRKASLKTAERLLQIAEIKKQQMIELEHKKVIHDMVIKQHQEARDEHARKKLIQVKKMYQLKKFRYRRALKALLEKRSKKYDQSDVEKWELRLEKRVEYQKYINDLLAKKEEERITNVENHKQRLKEEWDRIQMEIKQRKINYKKKRQYKKPKLVRRASVDYIYGTAVLTLEDEGGDDYSDSDVPLQPKKTASCKKDNAFDFAKDSGAKEPINICELQHMFENMMDYELCDALHKLMDIETDPNLPFDDQDPSYKLAEFIITNVIQTYNKDLTTDELVVKMIADRLLKLFDEIKNSVVCRARQIITSIQNGIGVGERDMDPYAARFSLVSFSRHSSTIGVSSYEINPNIDLRKSGKRKPTPAGSLASILAAEPVVPAEEINNPVLSRADAVFIEHYFVKFKRELTVSMGKQLFVAIKNFFAGGKKDVRKELIDMDKRYLAKTAAIGILQFNVCNLNFYSAIRLCSSVLAAEGTWLLYRQVLRPDRDTRGIKKHKRFQNDWICLMYEEKIKEELCCAPPDLTAGLFGNKC